MLLEGPFVSGRLLLENTPSDNAPVLAESVPVLFTVLAVVFVLAAFLFLPRFLSLAPLLFDSLFRARGSVSLENSVRYSNDRRLLATVCLIPASLLVYQYELWDAAFLHEMSNGWRLVCIIGVFCVFFLFRLAMYALFKPRRKVDFYRLSRRTAYTYFILLVLIALLTAGVLALFGCDALIIKKVLLLESGFVYAIFFARRAQILALSCNPFRTFLYLCALEILPVGALVVSAILL
jgi:hypothetical protein